MIVVEKELSVTEPGRTRLHPRTLYLTVDGLLEPLGRSQILAYLYPLVRRGFPYSVISLERESDLKRAEALRELERDFDARSIGWTHFSFQTGGLGAVLKNCRRMFGAARAAIRRDRIQLVHARSYVAAIIGWLLRLIYHTPYIFDMRGYWIDELADEGRWFTNPVIYRAGKIIEKRLVRDAAAIVTLTRIQADDLRAGLLKKFPDKPVEVVTTCADYEEFRPDETRPDAVPQEVRERLSGKLVVGLVGSINASYRMDESLHFFRHLLEIREDAHLLCLTRQSEQMEALIKGHGIESRAFTLASVPHNEMAAWLGLMDWALLLLNSRFSKRGSMPTKLAEFFAAGVRPVQYGCNEEVSESVRAAGSGIVLDSLSPESLRRAAREVASLRRDAEKIRAAREATRSHFSLAAGVEKYAGLLEKLS
jgi:glycosyltransferase involved in cell wall biosynthesis